MAHGVRTCVQPRNIRNIVCIWNKHYHIIVMHTPREHQMKTKNRKEKNNGKSQSKWEKKQEKRKKFYVRTRTFWFFEKRVKEKLHIGL